MTISDVFPIAAGACLLGTWWYSNRLRAASRRGWLPIRIGMVLFWLGFGLIVYMELEIGRTCAIAGFLAILLGIGLQQISN